MYSRKALITAVAVLWLSLLTACSAPWPWRRSPGSVAANNARTAKPDPQGLAGTGGPPGMVIEEGDSATSPAERSDGNPAYGSAANAARAETSGTRDGGYGESVYGAADGQASAGSEAAGFAGQQANQFTAVGSGGGANTQAAANWNGPPSGAAGNRPGGQAGGGAGGQAEAVGEPLPGQAFGPAQTIAIIGDQHVLAGEIEGAVNLILAISLPVDTPPEKIVNPGPELATQKETLFKQQLQGEVQAKIGYVDFLRNVPAERVPDLQKRIGESFAKELDGLREKARKAEGDDMDELRRRDPILLRVALFMNQRDIETLGDLDLRLRAYGTTLERQQRAYGEQKLSQMAVMKNIRRDAEISHVEMLDHYQRNREQYLVPAKARWEQLSVRFDKFPAERDAYVALAAMGNEVYLGGAALSAVAKRSSQEPEAENGGQHAWTNRGSLASKPLDEAIFSLPLDRLSEIIRDDRGLHIVRVLERTEDSYTPFLEAQVEIKEKIKNERRTAEVMAYLEKIRGNIRVWTIYDGEQGAVGEAGAPQGGRPGPDPNASP
ncbi:MAG: peptidylprolyl isomerase [Planctomycetota bacterium]